VLEAVKISDSEVYDLVREELEREEYSIILIASENYVDRAILEVQGSILTNKYAEGYPRGGTTAGASSSMESSGWRSTGPESSLVLNMRMFNRTQAPAPTGQ